MHVRCILYYNGDKPSDGERDDDSCSQVVPLKLHVSDRILISCSAARIRVVKLRRNRRVIGRISFTVCVSAAHSTFSARLRHEQNLRNASALLLLCVCVCVCLFSFFPRKIESNPRNRIARANYGEYREECARLEFPLCGTPEFSRC